MESVLIHFRNGSTRWIEAEIQFPRLVSEIYYYGSWRRVYYIDGAYECHI